MAAFHEAARQPGAAVIRAARVYMDLAGAVICARVAAESYMDGVVAGAVVGAVFCIGSLIGGVSHLVDYVRDRRRLRVHPSTSPDDPTR
ncbi:hypothetical protein EKD16_01955 [Streptomonospora litoralis]|uniref:Uncharacterized protein n=1 Tax=Streptomonospora litoralis TaxID=2498135 RepID=A0A4P6Q0X9_9ACTN|nr:hypothetical protein EKD16_01955 [Streptomonospora litoralis]